jgi:hypothetical protein
MHGTSVTISIWSISMVGIDRYIAVVKPFHYQKIMSHAKCYIIITCLWTAALITFIAPILTKHNFIYYHYTDSKMMCGLHWDYPAYCVITGLYIPVASGCILIFTSVSIHVSLKKHVKRLLKGKGDSRLKANQKALKLLIFTSIAYFTCWGPYVALVYAQSFIKSLQVPAWLEFGTLWMANSNSMFNVLIYSATNPAFRNALKKMFSRFTLQWQMCSHHGGNGNTGAANGSQIDGTSGQIPGQSYKIVDL